MPRQGLRGDRGEGHGVVGLHRDSAARTRSREDEHVNPDGQATASFDEHRAGAARTRWALAPHRVNAARARYARADHRAGAARARWKFECAAINIAPALSAARGAVVGDTELRDFPGRA